eukprot:4115510-Alexandrium_andersonii.AAC.1
MAFRRCMSRPPKCRRSPASSASRHSPTALISLAFRTPISLCGRAPCHTDVRHCTTHDVEASSSSAVPPARLCRKRRICCTPLASKAPGRESATSKMALAEPERRL